MKAGEKSGAFGLGFVGLSKRFELQDTPVHPIAHPITKTLEYSKRRT